jgi:hypothetical protein
MTRFSLVMLVELAGLVGGFVQPLPQPGGCHSERVQAQTV